MPTFADSLSCGGKGLHLLGRRLSAIAGWVYVCFIVLGLGLFSVISAEAANSTLEERKLPMRFTWNVEGPARACEPRCRSWVAAVGLITADTYRAFDEFSRSRDLKGATVVLDSAGGSVLDAIKLGRVWRGLGVSTTLGITVELPSTDSKQVRATIMPEAHCESMCVFLMLSGVSRYVPPSAHVRVHQIWMGDRAENAKTASYTADDLMIIQRDIGRLANYAFEMGGSGDLMALSLSVPPWEPLRELTADELRQTRIVSVESFANLVPDANGAAFADVSPKSPKLFTDRAPGDQTRTVEATVRNGPAASAP